MNCNSHSKIQHLAPSLWTTRPQGGRNEWQNVCEIRWCAKNKEAQRNMESENQHNKCIKMNNILFPCGMYRFLTHPGTPKIKTLITLFYLLVSLEYKRWLFAYGRSPCLLPLKEEGLVGNTHYTKVRPMHYMSLFTLWSMANPSAFGNCHQLSTILAFQQ